MNNKKILPLIIFIFITVSIITGGLVYFAYNISSFTTYGMDTTVANTYIGGKNYNQAFTTVQTEIVNWKNESEITLTYQGFTTTLDSDVFVFDVSTSLDNVNNGSHNQLEVTLKENWFDGFITGLKDKTDASIVEQLNQAVDKPLLQEALRLNAADLNSQKTLDVGDYIKNYNHLEVELNQEVLNVSDADVRRISLTLNETKKNEIIIEPRAQFSLLESLRAVPEEVEGDQEDEQQPEELLFNDDELSILGTGIYSLILPTNFTNIDKHISDKLPYYSQKGHEAKISYNHKKDLTFYNPNPYPLTIVITEESNQLVFRLKGPEFINAITIIPDVTTISPRTIRHEVTTLEPGRRRSIHGHEGYSILLRRIVTSKLNDNYKNREIEIITEDIYMPKETIIEIGVEQN